MPKQHAAIAKLVGLAAAKEIVKHARLVCTKTTIVKASVSNATLENRTSMPKQHAVVVILVRLVVATAFVQHVRLVIFKIPKAKRHAVIPVT